MTIRFIEFKKLWVDTDDYEELYAEAIFDKAYLREIIYHDYITPAPKFTEYIRSGGFIKDFQRDKASWEYHEDAFKFTAKEIKAPERLLIKVEHALEDAINYEYTDEDTVKTLKNFRDILSKL